MKWTCPEEFAFADARFVAFETKKIAGSGAFRRERRRHRRSDSSGFAGDRQGAADNHPGRERAGVSAGTLYQYFPNKSSLLQAVLQRHFDEVAAAVEAVCAEQRGQPLAAMVAALGNAYLRAKLRDGKASVALYAVSSDVDGVRIVQAVSGRLHDAIAAMLQSAPDKGEIDAALVTTMIQGAMSGVSRKLLESDDPERRLGSVEAHLIAMLRAYLEGCAKQELTASAPTLS